MRITCNPVTNRTYSNIQQSPKTGLFAQALEKQLTPESEHPAPSPTYQLTPQQIDDFKSKYNISDLSDKEFSSLLDELAQQGVISESDSHFAGKTEGGIEMIRCPLIIGLFPAGTHEKLFSYPSFTQGDLLDHLNSILEQNKLAVNWLANSKENTNSHQITLQNIDSIRSYQDDLSRVYQVLEQLK